MNKITREEFGMLSWAELWDRFDSLQSELEALEGGQGFVVTNDMWEDCPTDTIGWQPVWVVKDFSEGGVIRLPMNVNAYIPRPLPPKVTREFTSEQKVERLLHKRMASTNGTLADIWASIARDLADGKPLDDLCTAAGIPITTEEV